MEPKQAYRVEPAGTGCSHCNCGETWDIIGPDEIALGTSYGSKEQADEMAEALNDAYNEGAGSVAQTVLELDKK